MENSKPMNTLTTENLEKYLAFVFETELDVYIREKTLQRMKNTSATLGRNSLIYRPQKKNNSVNISDYMLGAGVIVGIIAFIIGTIIEYNGSGGGFFMLILSAIVGVIYFVIGLIVGGLTIGTVVGLAMLKSESNDINKDYEKRLEEYDAKIAKDNLRVKNEKRQKAALDNEIKAMESALYQTKQNLKKIYNYDVLFPDYQNIYAVSSIYGYINKGRTRSLTFNEQTGDQGAYNIYEYERRMNKIITNTEEILNKLDIVINNQYELANGLKNANARIDSLCSGVSTFMKSAANSLQSIERCQSIIAYNSERTRREMEFIAWMQL